MSGRLILGSTSKWRQEILRSLNVGPFVTMAPDIDEKAIRHDDPATMVQLIASGKLDALIPLLDADSHDDSTLPRFVITSDQVIVVDGVVREKPRDVDEARHFLASYTAGKPAECFVGVVVFNTATRERIAATAKATQWFKPITDQAVQALIDQGDVLWCAGGFCVEHMTEFELKRDGEIETVRGLPRALTLELLQRAGFVAPPPSP
jgi:septum formation protein